MPLIKNIHHLGYLVKDLEKTSASFAKLGYETASACIYDEERKTDILFMNLHDFKIELVCPKKDSKIYALLNKFPNQPYHICYEVTALAEAIQHYNKMGFMTFLPPAHAPAIAEDAQVAFLMNQHLGIVEFLEY